MRPALTPFQLTFNGLPDEVGTLLALLKNGVDAVKRALGKAGRHLFMVDLLPTHKRTIHDITYCYKPYFSRYHLLTCLGYLISSIPSKRRWAMTNLTFNTAKIAVSHFGFVVVEFMRDGSFTKGTQYFGNSNAGWNAAFRFCRERNLRVLSCEC